MSADKAEEKGTAARAGRRLRTPERLLTELETERCGAPPCADPAEAEGRALAGGAVASLSWGVRGAGGDVRLPAGASVVHHLLGEGAAASAARAPVELVAADPADVGPLAAAARRASELTGRAALLRVPGSWARSPAVLADPDSALLPADVPPVEDGEVSGPLVEALIEAAGLDVATREGPADADVVLVAMGAEVPSARGIASALGQAGRAAAVLVLRVAGPFPGRALRARLGAGAPRVVVLDEAARPGRLARNVALFLGEEPGILPAGAPDPAAALARALGGLPEGFQLPAVFLPGAGPARVAAPAGPWADSFLDALADRLVSEGDAGLSAGARRAERGGALWLATGGDAGAAPDLLVAAGVDALRPSGAVGSLRPRSVILLLVDAEDDASVLEALGPERCRALAASRHRLWWAPASLPASELVAVSAVLTAAPGGDAAGAARRLSRERLAAAPAPELDFRPGSALPSLPAAAAEGSLGPERRAALLAFHRRGPSGAQASRPGGPALPLLAALTAASAEARPAWPALVDGGSVSGLAPRIEGAIGELEAKGKSVAALRRVLPAVFAALRERGAAGDLVRLGEALDAAIAEPPGVRLSEAARAELDAAFGPVKAGLPLEAELLAPTRGAGLRLFVRRLELRLRPARRALLVRAAELAEAVRDRLTLDRGASDGGGLSVEAFGAAGRFFDPSALADGVPAHAASAPLGEGRRARLQAALARLESILAGPEPALVHVLSDRPERSGVAGAVFHRHSDPLGAAAGLFEGLSAEPLGILRTLEAARLDLDGAYDDEVAARLAARDWQGLEPEELDLLPAVVVVTDGPALRGGGLSRLSALLRSSRPVRVLVREGHELEQAADPSRFHAGLAWLAVAHREAYVVRADLSDPAALWDAFDGPAAARRPAVVFFMAPEDAETEAWARLAVLGRLRPALRYDPDAGESWADRLDLSGNPEPEALWVRRGVRVRTADEERELEVVAGPADAVAGQAAWRGHLLRIEPRDWDDSALSPLHRWIEEFDADPRVRALPFVWTMEPGGRIGRAVVSRALALAARDRMRAWRSLQEVAGYDNVHARLAAAAAESRVRAELDARVAELTAQHAAELARVRSEEAGAAMERLASVLLDLDTLPAAPPRSAAPAVAPAAAAPAAPAAQPAAPAATAEAPPAKQVVQEEPWIESMLCTSCNDCLTLNNRLFVYNADKQAEIGDLAAGSYADLVRAAEACPARCIHPGAPRAGDPTATPELIERAAAFA